MLEHPWLTMPDEYNYRMSEMEFKLFELKDQHVQLDNTDADLNFILNEKADLMNPNSTHQMQLDFDGIEQIIKKKQEMSGNRMYVYPGQLVETDELQNGGDCEDNFKNILFPKRKRANSENGGETTEGINNMDDSDIDSWMGAVKSGKKPKNKELWRLGSPEDAYGNSSEHSFNSGKMIDGYREFVTHMTKQQKKQAS